MTSIFSVSGYCFLIHEIKIHKKEKLWTGPVLVFIAWEWAIMTPDSSRAFIPCTSEMAVAQVFSYIMLDLWRVQGELLWIALCCYKQALFEIAIWELDLKCSFSW